MPRITHPPYRPGLLAALLGLGLACGDIQPKPGPDDTSNGDAAPTSRFHHTLEADGTVTTLVDATQDTAWSALDLDTRQEADFAVQSAWDLAFERFHIRTRGGVNGTGGVTVAVLTDAFESITRAPSSGFREDLPDGDDANDEPDNVFETQGGWYTYDVSTHKLSPRAQTYVLHSDAGHYFKLQILNYYDPAGTPAMLSFRWKQVDPPAAPLTGDPP